MVMHVEVTFCWNSSIMADSQSSTSALWTWKCLVAATQHLLRYTRCAQTAQKIDTQPLDTSPVLSRTLDVGLWQTRCCLKSVPTLVDIMSIYLGHFYPPKLDNSEP